MTGVSSGTTVDKMDVVRQLAVALQHLHSLSVINRNLKPFNTLITEDGGVIQITDFGLAAVLPRSGRIQKTGECGSYRWIAPVITRCEAYGCLADVYTTDIVLFQLFTGKLSFEDKDGAEVAFQVAQGSLHLDTAAMQYHRQGALADRCASHDVVSCSDAHQICEL